MDSADRTRKSDSHGRNKRMSEYIKREDALDMHFSVGLQDDSILYVRYAEVKDNIERIPAADVVEIVRCKNCRHNGSFDTDCPFGWRDEKFNLPDDMDFCSYGER